MTDIRSILSDSVSHALLRNNSISVTDELALVRQVSKLLDKREGDLKQVVLADRENRVGSQYYVSVTERSGSVSWAKVADELAKSAIKNGNLTEADFEALKSKNTGKPSEVVGVDPLPDLELVNEALEEGFTVIDFETTGLSTSRDFPVSVGLVRVTGFIEGTSITYGGHHYNVVNPGVHIPPATTAIHGITDEDVKTGYSLENMAKLVVDVMDATPTGILIGQNLLSFDLPLLRRFLPKGADAGWRYLDTRILSKLLWPGESASADAISARLGMQVREGHHNALSDARMTASHFVCIAELLLGKKEA